MSSSSEEILSAYRRFIAALTRANVLQLGVRDHLVLVRLVQAAQDGGWDRDALGAAIASAFATEREGWQAIWQRYCIYAPEPSDVHGENEDGAPHSQEDDGAANVADPSLLNTPPPKQNTRLRWMGPLAACGALAYLAVLLWQQYKSEDETRQTPDLAQANKPAAFDAGVDHRYQIPHARRPHSGEDKPSAPLDASVDGAVPPGDPLKDAGSVNEATSNVHDASTDAAGVAAAPNPQHSAGKRGSSAL